MKRDLDRFLDQAERRYLVAGETSFRFKLRFPKGSDRSKAEAILAGQDVFRVTGRQDVKEGFVPVSRPRELGLEQEDLLRVRPPLKEVSAAWAEARELAPDLVDWEKFLSSNYADARIKATVLPSLVRILLFFINAPEKVRDLYPRQIPHGLSTKLLGKEPLLLRLYEAHKRDGLRRSWADLRRELGLRSKPVHFQFHADSILFDGTTRLADIHSILNEENVSRWSLGEFEKILVVENEETFLPLRGILPGTLLLLGHGDMVAALTFVKARLAPDARVRYWGDIDKEGFEILSLAEEALGPVEPVLMDMDAIERYAPVWQKTGTSVPQERKFRLLDMEYRRVCAEGIRIEQEHLDISAEIELLRA